MNEEYFENQTEETNNGSSLMFGEIISKVGSMTFVCYTTIIISIFYK